MSELITAEEMLAALEWAAEQKGADYVYPEELKEPDTGGVLTCRYRSSATGEPCCIVGMAVDHLRPGFTFREYQPAHLVLDCAADDDARHIAADAQNVQDEGLPWREAVNYARDEFYGRGDE